MSKSSSRRNGPNTSGRNKYRNMKKRKASMSFFTSLGLSANNLRTKKGRTALTAFAGSIGIIGIALILALSNGVNSYIQGIEESTLAAYPLQITSTTFNISSLLGSMTGNRSSETADGADGEEQAEIAVTEVLNSMFSTVSTNDLSSLMSYLESEQENISEYTTAVEYIYDVEPYIYFMEENTDESDLSEASEETSNEEDSANTPAVRQVNPGTTMSGAMASSSMMRMFSTGSSTFYPMPADASVYESSYEVKAGHWPEDRDEAVLVLTSDGTISDYMLYALGLRDFVELDEMMQQYFDGENVTTVEDVGTYTYEDVLGITYKVVNAADLYAYDEDHEIWIDKTDNDKYMKELVADGLDLTIVGVVQPREDASSANLTSGINYPQSLITYLAGQAEDSEAVKAQIANADINIFTGEPFGENAASMELEELIQMDDDALSDAMGLNSFDTDSLNLEDMDLSSLDLSSMDLSGMDLDSIDLGTIDMSAIDMSQLDLSNIDLSGTVDMGSVDLSQFIDISSIDLSALVSSIDLSSMTIDMSGLNLEEMMSGIEVDLSEDTINNMSRSLLEGYEAWITTNDTSSYSRLFSAFSDYLRSDEAESVLLDYLNEQLDQANIQISREGLREVIESSLPSSESERVIDELSGTEEMTIDASVIADAVQDYIRANASVDVEFSQEDLGGLADAISSGYVSYAENHGLITSENVAESFSEYLNSEEARTSISAGLPTLVDMEDVQSQLSAAVEVFIQRTVMSVVESFTAQIEIELAQQLQTMLEPALSSMSAAYAQMMQQAMESMMESMMTEITAQISAQLMVQMGTIIQSIVTDLTTEMSKQMTEVMTTTMTEMMTQMTGQLSESISESLTEAFTIDADALSDSINFDMDSDSLSEMLMSMTSYVEADYDSNLAKLGYVNFNRPSEIDIYPADYEGKTAVVKMLDTYNREMDASGQQEQVITYTDMSATMMSSVNTIVNVITYVLIAFVAVSLIVSSIMISIITQISVMERTKEIGVLRAMGASKGNISQVFIAETFLIGSLSGILGILATRLMLIPLNQIIHALIGDASVSASLPWNAAVILILLSIGITVLSGLIPAVKAARMDPVTSLRSE